MSDEVAPPEVVVVDDVAAAGERALRELEELTVRAVMPLVSFATGATFAGFFELLGAAFEDGRIQPFLATHLTHQSIALSYTHLDMFHTVCFDATLCYASL